MSKPTKNGPIKTPSSRTSRAESKNRKTQRGAAPVKRANSKQAKLIAMLQRPEGATVAKIAKAFGWQPHTVRGVFAGALKKKLGLNITSEKTAGGERVYRIA